MVMILTTSPGLRQPESVGIIDGNISAHNLWPLVDTLWLSVDVIANCTGRFVASCGN
jgi:hypothetical protein